MIKIRLLLLSLTLGLTVQVLGQDLIISEFLAINDDGLLDEDSNYSDWIEIQNNSAASVDLAGYYLSDNADNLKKWKFPSQTIEAGAYLVVFASNEDRATAGSELHTNFKLSGSGEFLALSDEGGVVLSSFDPFPVQQADVSYGLVNGQYTFLSEPSPGAANSGADAIDLPQFSQNRGFYDAAFDLTIETTAGGSIIYTTDGSIPTASNGTAYSAPININTTTVLSAAIKDAQGQIGTVVTHTYIFTESVCQQDSVQPGYPELWTESPADYEMDPEVCTAENQVAMDEALKDIPTISLVTNAEHLFSDEDDTLKGGIYIWSLESGDVWERPTSMEYIDPATGINFQVNAGLRLHGGNSRKSYNSPKHGFRVSFRSKYGPSKLNFNMFEEKGAVNEFNNLVLRAGYNYSWTKNSVDQCENADYLRDPFAKETQRDMDRTAAHQRFVHLYINGLYWGVYNLAEKINNDFVESYLGGSEDDIDVVKDHNGVTDGTRDAWNALISATKDGYETVAAYFSVQGKNPDGTENPAFQNLLDVRNLSDYILINFYIGNKDWDRNNWLAARDRVKNNRGFRFFCWDAETSMTELDENIVKTNNVDNPTWIFSQLMANEEYRVYFSDRIHKHFYNGGDLTPEKTIERMQELQDGLGKAMMAESARWGDHRRDKDPIKEDFDLYTYEDHWLPRLDYLKNTYLPQRSEIVLNQLKDAGFYPDIDAPEFSDYGGDYEEAVSLMMTAPGLDIYFTTDGTDPRAIGGAVSQKATSYQGPVTLAQDAEVYARSKSGQKWSALTRAKFDFEGDIVIVDTTTVIDTVTVVDTVTVIDTVDVTDTLDVLSLNKTFDGVFYPNPAKDELHFTWGQLERLDVSILNLTGQFVYQGRLNHGQSIDVQHLPSGVYLLRYQDELGRKRQQRIMKE